MGPCFFVYYIIFRMLCPVCVLQFVWYANNPIHGASQVVQWSKALQHSAKGITTYLGSIPGCITNIRDRESHRAVHNWPSVVWIRGGFGRGALNLAYNALERLQARSSVEQCFRVKQVGVKKRGSCFGGLMTRPSSPERVGELQRWDKIEIGEKKGVI